RTTLPASISSASERKSCAVRAWSRPKACFPAFLAHSKAFIMLFLPDRINFRINFAMAKVPVGEKLPPHSWRKRCRRQKAAPPGNIPTIHSENGKRPQRFLNFPSFFSHGLTMRSPGSLVFFFGIHMGNGQVVYEFGEFQLDLTRQLLWHHGEQVVL